MSSKFCLCKIFFHHWQKFNSKDKVNLDYYFYFLTLYIHNYIDSSFESMIFVPFSEIYFYLYIQFKSIFERNDLQEFLPLEIKKHGRCFLATAICLFIRTSNFLHIQFLIFWSFLSYMFLYGLFYNEVFDIRIIGMECFILHFEI